MLRLVGFVILASTSVVIECQNHGASSQNPYANRGRTRQRSVVDATSTSTPPNVRHGNGEIEYRLNRLENLLIERLDNIRAEVRETNTRLQSLEYKSTEVRSMIENLKSDARLYQPPPASSQIQSTEDLEFKVENLGKGIQILTVATRILTSDVESLKQNVSALINETRSLEDSTSNLLTKEYFSRGLADLNRHQNSRNPCVNGPRPSEGNALSTIIPRNCKEVRDSGHLVNGIYSIQPEKFAKPFMAVCDFETRGGDWTVIQRRFDGSQDFYQSWHDYKYGFGNLEGEFWLGLENIHLLTGSQVNELLIELEDFDRRNTSALYASFSIGSEMEGYSLKVLGQYTGDAGDSLIYHAGNRFSAKDLDVDNWQEGSCAQIHNGGWWYKSCDKSNLNGRYLRNPLSSEQAYQGMYWNSFRGPNYSLLRSRILVRPKEATTSAVLDEIFSHDNKETYTMRY